MSPNRTSTPVTDGLAAFELAALRNAPLSVARPGEIGTAPMARGRFLAPRDGAVIVENLQVPGRAVLIEVGSPVEAFFQHDGEIYQFSSRVLGMDTPVRLNEVMVVRGMTLAAPGEITRGNRRAIYRQSFAPVNPPVDVGIWAVPLSVLTPCQAAEHAQNTIQDARVCPLKPPNSPHTPPERRGIDGYRVEKGAAANRGLAPVDTLMGAVADLCLGQLAGLMRTTPHWRGEIADASEFGLGLTVQRVVYSRLKVFQPLVVRFQLPGVSTPLEFLLEVRRVQALRESDARLGGLMLVNTLNPAEVRSARELARFSALLQRDRARRLREAG